MKARRFFAWCLVLVMTMTFMPSFTIGTSAEPAKIAEPTVIESSTRENSNQAGGIIYTKTSTAKSDGTIDITLTAHTTGVVKQMSAVTPTDIVLVLDTSGSMGGDYTTTTINGYNAVTGDKYTYTTGIWFWEEEHTAYGFNNSYTYCINTGTVENPVYTSVTKTGRDGNGYDMYEYTKGTDEIKVYPLLTTTPSVSRENNYEIEQFYAIDATYSTANKMTDLKSAVKSFIDTTVTMNTGLDESDMHNISIVRFASNASVVAGLTAVDGTGAATLKNAVDGLTANGATAVDYGLAAAEEVLMSRSEVHSESAVDRNEVIIVFTDGEPNHQNGFDTNVANDAIEIAGNMKTAANVKIYTVCIAEGADANDETSNINKFMHYVSSNYPDATSMTSPGTRVSGSDYYKTIDNDHSLSLLFESIIQEIDHPTITMGEEATMVDTISPYFDFVGTASNVKLQTSLRNADGTWADPENDSSLSCEIVVDRLIVNGFDFDANFVSSTGRGTNGDFYGKQLVISFTVSPDYDVIDAASATLMDGILPTNSGLASLNDSDSTPAAEVETPVLNTHQVVYKVNGVSDVDDVTYNRFTGSTVTVDAIPSKKGHTFSGWTMNGTAINSGDEFIMPAHDVVIEGTFVANTYNVNYQYSTTPPTGAPNPPAAHTAQYGSEVTVAAPATFTGYVFKGWKPLQTDVTVTGGTFTMPDKDVTLVGYFESSTTTPYIVEHYLETLTDDVYETTPALVEDGFTGTTGNTVTATPLNRFTGFTYNASVSTAAGTITGDGNLVLKLYYDRNEYTVTYDYEGDTNIAGLPALPSGGTFKYGQQVTVADKAIAPAGYEFTGWYRGTSDNPVDGTFTMPAYNVQILGYFTPDDGTEYTVEHYLMDTDGQYETTPALSETFTGTTGNTAVATPKNTFEGFTFNASVSTTEGVIAGDGSLVLTLYYDRNKYTVSYEYERDIPSDATPLPDDKDYYHEETVEFEPDAQAEGYTFSGWHIHDENVDATGGSFEMPKRNVVVYGYFTANTNTPYKVEHYLEKLDGTGYEADPYQTQNLTGITDTEVTAKSLSIAGFTYNASVSTATGAITGDGNLVLKLYYDRNEYTVSYEYEGDIPAGASVLPANETYVYGEEVTAAAKAIAPAGYTFVGWYKGETTNIVTSFEMPDRNVVLSGYFKPGESTPYAVYHYLETLTDGVYEAEPEVEEYFTGTTGHTVSAKALNRFTGFTYNETKSAPTMSGKILGDGTLVLKVYYDRNQYEVTYGYEGDIPTGAPTLPAPSSYDFGADVIVAAKATAPAGYTFIGWYRGTKGNAVDGTFEMPAYNVHILGVFEENTNTPYRVEHYLQNMDSTGYELDGTGETRHGTTDSEVSALHREYPGFTYNDAISTTSGTIAGDGSLVLKFYYDRNAHDVIYVYDGILPTGTPVVPEGENDVLFGTQVNVEDEPDVPGYTFSGWNTTDVTVNSGKFEMPDKNVVLKGGFTANEVEYKVNYWFQKINAGSTFDKDDYELDADSYSRIAFVGQHVEADSKEHTGFYVNTDHSKSFGHVTVDEYGVGNLVLDIYFDRHTYNVTYGYYGEQPAGAPDISDKNKTGVRYGTELTVEDKPVLDGHSFEGWYTHTATVDSGKFVMPNHDVEFLGGFVKQYTVDYDLNNGTGADGEDYSTQIVDAGTDITLKAAPTRNGYTFKGWESEVGENASGDTVTVNQNIIFVAQWSYNGGGGGGSVTKYTLTYESNGGTEYKAEKYNRNTTVDLDKRPKKQGYVFEGWYEDKELTKYVEEVKMTKDITVYAKWVEDNGGAGNGYDTPGSLNGEDHFAYVVGYPDGTVRPNDNISRAEVTAIFFRLLKPDEIRDKNLTTENCFNDVNDGDWHNTAISTMAKLGIVKGRTTDSFAPDAFITRAEFATICARFDDSEFEVVDNFTDVAGHWAEHDIHEAATHGWIRGYEDGTFKPDQFITRAEAMTMINRVLNRVPEDADDLLADMIIWPDNNDKSAWYYLVVQEATNSHDYEMKNHIYEKWTALREVTDWTKYE